MEKAPSIKKLHALHRAGKIEAAKKGYLKLLHQKPHNAEALHALGLIAVEENNLAEATDYFNTAVQYQPDNPTLQLHLANVLKMQGLIEKAAALLENTVKTHPEYAPAFNNLGTLYFSLGKLDAAIHCYQQAIAKASHYIDADYNLGLALIKVNQLIEARLRFQKILENAPQHAAARFQLGRILMQEENWDEAIHHFLELEKQHPQHLETQINLATCFLREAAFTEAQTHYSKALDLNPNDIQILFNLGYISSQQGQVKEAIEYYQAILKIDPDNFSAHHNLGSIYVAERQTELALAHFQQALRLQPDNTVIDHLIKVLKKDPQLSTSPPAYLKSLFDSYADHYDHHLLTTLNYQVSDTLFHALEKARGLPEKKLVILDMGCGTGLCGVLFKPLAAQLVGIDVSPQMLKKAAEKNIYTTLIEADGIDYLQQQNAVYDLIIAGDVLVYMGNIELLIKYAKTALRPGGFFIFNTEISEDQDFAINLTGRFTHHKNYLDNIIKNNALTIRYYETAITRLQNNQPVYGHFYVVQTA